MKIGLRTIKTGLAVVLAFFVSNALGIESPFYAAVAAIIVMQPTVSDSWKTGFYRMLGTFIGAVVGAVFAVISPGNPLLGGLGIVVIILVMNKLECKESISIGGVVFISILLNTQGDNISYALHRLLDTSIGIVIAVLINYLVYPPNYDGKIVDEIKQISKNILKYNVRSLQMLLREKEDNIDLLQQQIQEIEKELDISEKFLELQKKEEKIKIQKDNGNKKILLAVSLEKEIFQHLRNLQNVLQKGINKEVVNLVKEDIDKIKCALTKLEERKEEFCEIYSTDENSSLSISYILEDIKRAKRNLKNNENLNDYPTDEVVKLLVFLYNLEEALLKFNMIICC